MSRLVALGLVCLATVGWSVGCSRSREADEPLPRFSDIERIMCSYQVELKSHRHVKLEVERKYWARLYDTLLPAKVDLTPAKWVYLHDLTITLKNRKVQPVDLYNLYRAGDGAFSTYPPSETGAQPAEKRVYYRGGSSERLEALLREIYEEKERAEAE